MASPSARGFAFPRSLRLRGETTFRTLFRKGARARGALLLVVARPSGLAASRLGISVSRKVTRSSPGRNRLKRIVREAFRLNRSRLPAGFDFAVCPTVPGPRFTLAAATEELARLARLAASRAQARAPQGGPEGPDPRGPRP